MLYATFRAWVVDTIVRASAEKRLAFARDTVARMLETPEFAQVDQPHELTTAAWAAFFAAKREVFTVSPSRLKAHLAVIFAGVLTDGSMDSILLGMIVTIDAWASYVESENVEHLLLLADERISHVDWLVSASIDDFLATEAMQLERDRIYALLSV